MRRVGIKAFTLMGKCMFQKKTNKILHTKSYNHISKRSFCEELKVKELDDPGDDPCNTTIIFNLENGSLLHTKDILNKSIQTLLSTFSSDISVFPIDFSTTTLDTTGESFRNCLNSVFNSQKDDKFKNPAFLKEQVSKLSDIYSKLSDSEENITINENVHEVLKELYEDGNRLVICSNLPQKTCDKLVEKFKLKKYFTFICGGDVLPVCKPDPGHLIYTIEVSGGIVEDSLMVCSTINDIKAAKKANIPTIALPINSKIEEAMIKYHPEIVINSFSEIPDSIEELKEKSQY